jgi:hypothetical protein
MALKYSSHNSSHNWLNNLGLVSAGTLMAIVLAEVLCRFLHPLSTVEYRMDEDVGPILVAGQTSRWVNEDYDVLVTTNRFGFHDVEHEYEKSPDRYRIIVLGDSYIEALQLPIEQGFTHLLEQRLGNLHKGRKVEVINLGLSGSGPAQYYRILDKKGLIYKPDLVVMAIFPDNDIRDSDVNLSGAIFKPYYVLRQDGRLDYQAPRTDAVGSAVRPWLRRSAFLQLVRQGIASFPLERWLASVGLLAPTAGITDEDAAIPLGWSIYLYDPPLQWRDAEKLTLRIIHEAQVLSEKHGAEFLVMIIGSVPAVENRWQEVLGRYPGSDAIRWDFERPVSMLRELGRQGGFDVVDLIQPFRTAFVATGQSSSWPHDGHWNARGHQLAAEVITSHLLEHGEKYLLN